MIQLATSPTDLRVARDEWTWAIEQARSPKLRTMRQFAEQEIVLPDGPYAGRRYQIARQP